MKLKKCFHDDPQKCMLYAATHMGDGLGCDDGKLDHGSCAVSRGKDYMREAEKIKKIYPLMYAEYLGAQIK